MDNWLNQRFLGRFRWAAKDWNPLEEPFKLVTRQCRYTQRSDDLWHEETHPLKAMHGTDYITVCLSNLDARII